MFFTQSQKPQSLTGAALNPRKYEGGVGQKTSKNVDCLHLRKLININWYNDNNSYFSSFQKSPEGCHCSPTLAWNHQCHSNGGTSGQGLFRLRCLEHPFKFPINFSRILCCTVLLLPKRRGKLNATKYPANCSAASTRSSFYL